MYTCPSFTHQELLHASPALDPGVLPGNKGDSVPPSRILQFSACAVGVRDWERQECVDTEQEKS